jgi:hypothetical protein
MGFPKGVRAWQIDRFTNAHANFIQPLDANQSYDLFLTDEAWRQMDQIQQYQACTKNLQWIIGQVLDKQMNVRAMGSGWSISKVAVSDDALINTKSLRHKFSLKNENLNPGYLERGNSSDNHFFLQCGNTIIGINDFLEKRNPAKCLRASGGSNGQTIVGAFSTGTHGAALFYGGLTEMILGLHIVTGPDQHYYIERHSKPVTSHQFHEKLGATVILDDDLFYSALVSFGSFGIIHGVLIEAEDKFLLEQKLKRVPFDDDLKKAITDGNFKAIEQYLKYPADDKDHPLYHFELAINPHDFAFNSKEKGAYLRVMHKVPYREDYIRINHPASGYTYGDDTLGLMQTVLDGLEATTGFLNRLLVPKLVNAVFSLAYNRPPEAVGTIGETFRNTIFRGKLFSAAFGLERKDLVKVIEHCLALNSKLSLAGVLAVRFVRGTSATLGFNKWENSCVLEFDGVDAHINHQYIQALANLLERENIPYTLHWGKVNRILNKQRVEQMYGKEKVALWKQQRSRIMSKEVQAVFNNEFMEQCGLDEYLPYHDEVVPV